MNEPSEANHSASRTIQRNGRTIGYTIVEAEKEVHRLTAVVVFLPISGCSHVLSKMKLQGYQCSVVAVDRPCCGATFPLVAPAMSHGTTRSGCCHSSPATMDTNKDENLQRICGHAQDVVEVLQLERISMVYILGVCIGHPYAIETCRQLQSDRKIEIGGLTLVAPFVSTVCPYSWYVARFGARVPSSILYGSTEAISSIGACLVPRLLRPSTIQKLVTPDENDRGAWTEDDFEDAYQMALKALALTKDATAIEARVGTSKIWQTEVCDKFAIENGFDLNLVEKKEQDGVASHLNTSSVPEAATTKTIPIRIYACKEDKLVSLESLKWIAKRCYGDVPINVEESIHSHEVMTFFGGPPRAPILLHKIAREWGLLDSA
jgi:pimeloyl-ACP methyl ester carboxylesterase